MTVKTEIPISLGNKIHPAHQQERNHHHHFQLHQILQSHHLYIHNHSIQQYILNHQENLERQRELRHANRLQATQNNRSPLSTASIKYPSALPESTSFNEKNHQSLHYTNGEPQQRRHSNVIKPNHPFYNQHSTQPLITTHSSTSLSNASLLTSIASSPSASSLRNRRISHQHHHHNHHDAVPLKSTASSTSTASKQRSQIHFLLMSAFAYILSPIDLIPEMIFGVFGILDDLLFLFLCLFCVAIVLLYPLVREIRRTLLSKVGLQHEQQQQNVVQQQMLTKHV